MKLLPELRRVVSVDKKWEVIMNSTRVGKVLRIEKASIHDGDGLRTVVFVKGCPLRCQWCSTPESQSIECMMDYGYDATPESIMKIIRKDEIFYFQSGGGVTISGGEVLLQSDFVRDILEACQDEGINTAIESSLYGPYEALEKLLPYLNTVFVDFKLADEEEHRKYTGVSNETIKENIRRMEAEFSGDIHVRIPSIPTVNMTEENMRLTADFFRPMKNINDIELLPYHKLGVDTYRKLGKKYELEGVKTPDHETMSDLAAKLKKHDPGCAIKINGVYYTEV